MDVFTYGIKSHLDERIPVVVLENGPKYIKERYRLILVMRGNGYVEYANGEHLGFESPVVLCLNENEMLNWNTETISLSKEIVFHPLFLNPIEDPELLWLMSFVERTDQYFGVISIDMRIQKKLNILMDALLEGLLEQPDDYWPCRARSYLIESLLVVDRLKNDGVKQRDFELSNSVYDESICEIARYLENHYSETITLTDLTKLFKTNRTTLGSHFKSVYGKTIMDYLIGIRIEISKAMLRDTALSIGEILERTGFVDVAHFTRTFKKRTGETPSQYRQTRTWL